VNRFTVRAYEESRDREAYAHVRSFVYRGGGEVKPDERLLRDDCIAFVVEDQGRIVGSAVVLKMTCSIGGHDLSCAGVAGVGVLPEERQTGAGSALMNGVVRLCRDAGYQMSSLYPFRETWYRRFGYATAGLRWKIHCPTDRFPRLDAPLPVRLVEADARILKGVEASMARRFCGYNVREPDQWWRSLGGDSPMTVYVAGDPAEAYCVLRLRNDFWGWVEVKEFGWSTEAGYRSMIAQYTRLSMNHLGVIWNEPISSPFMTEYLDQSVKAESISALMFRSLDHRAVNDALGSDITVHDPILGGEGSVSVGDFTRAALGHDTFGLRALNCQTCYCVDFF
jgi:predicted acetyltransferase